MTSLQGAVSHYAETAPDSLAVRTATSTISYSELDLLSSRTTSWLRARGIGKGDRVVVRLPRGAELIPTLLGVLGCGAAFVPVDISMPHAKLTRILRDCRPALVVTDRTDVRGLGWPMADPAEMQSHHATAHPTDRPGLDLSAYVLYTSGSTGEPKGVVVGTAAMYRYLSWARSEYEMDSGSGAPLFTSIAFDATLTSLFGPLLAGRTVEVIGEDDPVMALAARLQQRPDFSFVKATPHHVRLLAELLHDRRPDTALRRLVVGGDVLDTATVRAWTRVFPVPVVNEYGPTETVVGCTAHTVIPTAVGDMVGDVPIGTGVAGADVRVLEPDGGPTPVGQIGELFVGGPSADSYYLGRAAATAARFVPDPEGPPGARRYRTGDLASLRADGVLEFHGRADRQVKVRGFRVELGEIESAVRATPGVIDAAALVDRSGPDIMTAVVYTGDASPEDIRSDLTARVPSWVVPAAIVRTEVLPTTTNAKVDLATLAELVAGGSISRTEWAGPIPDAVTATLLEDFNAVLAVADAQPDTDFFRSGGNSMSGIRLVARLRRRGHDVTPADLVANPTPSALGSVLRLRTASAPSSVWRQSGDEIPLTPAQRDFFALDLPTPGHWNQVTVIAAPDGLDTDRLRSALETIAKQQDVLHYRFRTGRQIHLGGPPAAEFREVSVPDLAALDDAVREANTGLDLEQGPLARWVLVHIAGAADHLVLVAHHLIVDEVSWHVFLDDLAVAYRSDASGETQPQRGSFADWRAALSRFALRPEVRAQEDHWVKVLARPAGEILGASEVDDYSGEHYTRDGIDEATTTRLLEAAATVCIGVHELLLGCVVAALTAALSISPPRVDVETHGRVDLGLGVDASRVMGWCTAIFPVVLEGGTALDLVRSARHELGALRWHGTDFGLLQPEGAPAPSRTAKVLFNYLGERDRELDQHLGWSLAEPVAGAQSPATGQRPYPLEFQARTMNGQLRWEWRAGVHHSPETVHRLSVLLRDTLHGLCDELGSDPTMAFAASGLAANELAALLADYSGHDDEGMQR